LLVALRELAARARSLAGATRDDHGHVHETRLSVLPAAREAFADAGEPVEERDATARGDWRAELMRYTNDKGVVPTIVTDSARYRSAFLPGAADAFTERPVGPLRHLAGTHEAPAST